MMLKYRRIAALLISCALLLAAFVSMTVQAGVGEKIYAEKLKKSASEISVVKYGENGTDVIDTWREGILGRKTGEWLYCTEPHVKFKEGYKTGVPAEDHMSSESISLIGALMYWYDEHMCAGTDSTDEYMFKQEIVWNILNLEKQWRPDCRYEHGLGETCSSGHSLESHREKLFSEGMDWAEANMEYVETEATVYEGEGQPLMDLTYSWQPKGKIRITKKDSETEKIIPVKAEFEITAAEDIVAPDGTALVKKGTVVDTVVTGKDGKGSSKELFLGKYTVKEKNAPAGYLLNPQTFNVELSYKDQDTAVVYRELTVTDAPVMGRIRIMKTDEYTGEPLKDSVFSIIAAEDITTEDGTVRAEKGTVVAELTSGEDGIAESKPLYPGEYIIREVKQPDGYIFPEQNEWPVELKYKDQDTAAVTVTEEITNRPTVVIIDKKITGSEQRLSGVKFVIWNKDKEDPSGPEMAHKEVCITDENGQICIEAPEPGHYCVQELEGVPGYATDPDIHEFVISEDGRIEGQEEYTLTVENRKTGITETNAVSADTDSKDTYPWKKTTVKDTVSLVNIQPGEKYRLTGVLADQETGEPIREGGTSEGDLLTAELEFTGTDPEMTVDVIFEFDASPFAGRSLVVYEYLYQDDLLISEHTDPEDVKQQFHVVAPEMRTTAVSAETGIHEAETSETAVIRDRVEYKNIMPGSCILKGILMDRESGKPLLINGEKITAEKEIEISETEGTIEVDFTLDASGLNGRSVVVFEYLYRKGCEEPAASHEDIRDEGQTVIFRDKIVPETGDMSSVIPLLSLAAAGAGTAAVLLFSRREKQQKRKRNGCRHRKKKVIK